MPRILFYYHHFGGFGHGMRIYSICRALKEYDPSYEAVVINSGLPQKELQIARYAYVINLPPFTACSGLFRGVVSAEGTARAFAKRKDILTRIAAGVRPAAAFIEHYPFGRESLAEEIGYFINQLNGRGCLVYSLVRDVVFPKIDEGTLRQRIMPLRGIFVHSDQKIGLSTPYSLGKECVEKILFTGRVFSAPRQPAVRNRLPFRKKKTILISIGGGIDGEDILFKMLKVKDTLRSPVPIVYRIATGTAMKDDVFRSLVVLTRGRKDVFVRRFIPEFSAQVARADVYVTRAGYNAVNNYLFSGTPALFFPRRSDPEQGTRLNYMRKYYPIECVSDGISLKKLASRLNAALEQKTSPVLRPAVSLPGGTVTARLIGAIVHPRRIKIRLTTECNMHCAMCSWKQKKQELPYAVVKNILQQARVLNVSMVNFTGGEPRLHSHFFPLLEYGKSLGIPLSVSTNGTFDDAETRLLSTLVKSVDVSLHSAQADVDDMIKGVPGAFDQAVTFIRNIKTYNRRIEVQVNTTLRKETIKGIHRIVSLLGPWIQSLSFSVFTADRKKDRSGRVTSGMLKYFYSREVPIIQKIRKDFPGLTTTIAQPAASSGRNRVSCGKLLEEMRINAAGTVSPCCVLDDVDCKLGNVLTQDLSEIIGSDVFQDFCRNQGLSSRWCRTCGRVRKNIV